MLSSKRRITHESGIPWRSEDSTLPKWERNAQKRSTIPTSDPPPNPSPSRRHASKSLGQLQNATLISIATSPEVVTNSTTNESGARTLASRSLSIFSPNASNLPPGPKRKSLPLIVPMSPKQEHVIPNSLKKPPRNTPTTILHRPAEYTSLPDSELAELSIEQLDNLLLGVFSSAIRRSVQRPDHLYFEEADTKHSIEDPEKKAKIKRYSFPGAERSKSLQNATRKEQPESGTASSKRSPRPRPSSIDIPERSKRRNKSYWVDIDVGNVRNRASQSNRSKRRSHDQDYWINEGFDGNFSRDQISRLDQNHLRATPDYATPTKDRPRHALATTHTVGVREKIALHPLKGCMQLVADSITEGVFKWLKIVADTRLAIHQIPKDHVRIHWTCKCGKRMFDDFIEQSPGAARRLEQHLNRPKQHTGEGSSSSSSSGHSKRTSQASIDTQSTAATSVDITENANSCEQSTPWTPNPSARVSSMIWGNAPIPQPLWLLACVEKEKFVTKLAHLDVNAQRIRSDMDLATLIKAKYEKLRPGWKHALRLRGLKTIQFVQFELHRTHVVDIRKCPDVPAEGHIEYSFLQSDLIPPVGERYLMHLFHHAEDYEDELLTYKRLPKKIGAKLRVGQNTDVGIGWGIHLVEGFQAYKIWTLFTGIFVLASLIFGIVWAIRKGDVQGAFGVASYVCTLFTMIIGCCITYLD